MTIKRAILLTLTVFAIAFIGLDLLASWKRPQFQSRLELYQTNLLLRATEWQDADANLNATREALLGKEPLKTAETQYQEARESAEKNLARAQQLTQTNTGLSEAKQEIAPAVPKLERLLAELDLRLGILQVAQQKTEKAQQTWAGVIQRDRSNPQSNPESNLESNLEPLSKTAAALAGLWSEPPRLFPDADSQFKKNLDGWFRDRALARLFDLQQRQDALTALRVNEQTLAEQALTNLAIVSGIPALGCILGVGLLLVLVGQWLVQRKQALLSPSTLPTWTTPWDWEVSWQVVLGFVLVGQLLVPIGLGLLQTAGLNFAAFGERGQAVLILVNYLLLAGGGLGVLAASIKAFLPLPGGWFQVKLVDKWVLWGIGGYLAALPLVIVVSLLNQQIWQGQGGSNPILPIALEGKDPVSLGLFLATAAIAAPVFEEILFRGFLLPSLTRYFPTWGAIFLSSLIFAVAHLSLSEVLPLTVLGMVLGFVYARSQNLLSSMLLHSLWNSGTLLSLFLLGRSS